MCRQRLFQLFVGAAATTDQLRRAAAYPVGRNGILDCPNQPGVVGQAQVVVAGENCHTVCRRHE